MQFKSLTLAALVAGASAQVVPTDSIGWSVINVLATAIPPESISLATANPSAFSAELASSISAGQTPAWYQALPSDVKSYLPKLYPANTAAETTVVSTASEAPASTPLSSATASISASPTGGNSTTVVSVSSATLGSTGGANSEAPTPTGAASTGGAAYPTAVFGAGVAGAIGFLGMLAL